MDTERCGGAIAGDPRELDVGCHEAGPVAAGGDPGGDLAGAFGVAVEEVSVDGGGDDHDADALEGSEDGEDHVVPMLLESLTDDREADHEEDGGWVCDVQTGFGIDTAVVTSCVEVSECIVQPVACEPTDEDTYDAEEVKEADILGREVVGIGEVDGDCGVNTDNPGEVEEVVAQDHKDRNLGDCDDWAHDGLDEAALVEGLELLNTKETLNLRATSWTRDIAVSWNMAIVERLIDEEQRNQANSPHDGADPERPWPGSLVDDEGGDQRAKVWTEDDAELDIVDHTWMFVEEPKLAAASQ